MNKNLPMELPKCKQHGEMILRSRKQQTPEQEYCGTWYDCPICKGSVLFVSAELQEIYKKANIKAN